MKPRIVSILARFYHALLWLYPAGFLAEFGQEMEEVFAASLTAAGDQGLLRVATVCLKELVEFPANLAVAYRQSTAHQGVVVMNREVKWSVWPAWVALNLLSIPLAVLMAMALVVLVDKIAAPLLPIRGPATAEALEPFLLISMLLLATAGLQWLLLRRYLHHAGAWVPLTVLGWLGGVLLIYLAGLVGGFLGRSLPGEWAPALGPPLLGAVVGGTQWLYLRRVIDNAGYWVVASALGIGSN